MLSPLALIRPTVSALVVGLLATTLPLAAQPPSTQVLDQEQALFDATANFYAIGGDGSGQILAQTVVAGVDGVLTEIQLPVACASGRLVIEIRELSGAEPAARTLRRRTVPAGMLPPTNPPVFRSFLLGRSLNFSAGDPFAIVLSNPTGSCGIPPGPIGDSYLPGEAFFEAAPNPPGWVPFSETEVRLDLPFRTFMLIRP